MATRTHHVATAPLLGDDDVALWTLLEAVLPAAVRQDVVKQPERGPGSVLQRSHLELSSATLLVAAGAHEPTLGLCWHQLWLVTVRAVHCALAAIVPGGRENRESAEVPPLHVASEQISIAQCSFCNESAAPWRKTPQRVRCQQLQAPGQMASEALNTRRVPTPRDIDDCASLKADRALSHWCALIVRLTQAGCVSSTVMASTADGLAPPPPLVTSLSAPTTTPTPTSGCCSAGCWPTTGSPSTSEQAGVVQEVATVLQVAQLAASCTVPALPSAAGGVSEAAVEGPAVGAVSALSRHVLCGWVPPKCGAFAAELVAGDRPALCCCRCCRCCRVV